MYRVHCYFTARSYHYNRWHQHPRHKHVHWLGVLIVFFISTSFIWAALQNTAKEINSLADNFSIPKAHAQTSPIPAFPTAEGYGALSVGGRGGRVIEVTNLNDSGPGSLRQALQYETGPRIIIFKVSGNIYLNSRIIMEGEDDSFVTIAGQTAPGDGIAVVNRDILLRDGVHDIVIRHLRSRVGLGAQPDWDIDCLTIFDRNGTPYNIIVDHFSCSWAIDEGINIQAGIGTGTAPYNVTIQWSIMGEGSLIGHVKPDHSAGFLIHGNEDVAENKISFHHNYLPSNYTRNPKTSGSDPRFINNVIYNWGYWPALNGGYPSVDSKPDWINNYFKYGPSFVATTYKNETRSIHLIDGVSSSNLSLYVSGNIVVEQDGSLTSYFDPSDPFSVVGTQRTYTKRFQPNAAQPTIPVTKQDADAAKDLVLSNVGATKPKRDSVDTRMVNDFYNGTGRIPDQPDQMIAPPLNSISTPQDSDHDGMPDAWETTNGFNSSDPADGNLDADGDGYTNVEEYLNELAGDQPPGQAGGASIDQRINGDDWELPSYVERSNYTGFFWKTPSWALSHNVADVPGIHYAKNIPVDWKAVNTSPGVYDWSSVDAAIADLNTCNSCGFGLWPWYNRFNENIPNWVTTTYDLKPMSNGAIAAWHPNSQFQEAVKPFLIALADRYKNDPRFLYIDMRSPFDRSSGEFSISSIYNEAKNQFQLTPANFESWGKQFFDDYKQAFAGQEKKLIMMISGQIHPDLKTAAENLLLYGYALGYGQRDGLPSNTYLWSFFGHNVSADGYVAYDESLPPYGNRSFLGSELTEFDPNSDDFGPRSLTKYRFWYALLYTQQMHRSWLAIPGRFDVYNDAYYGPMLKWAEMEFGKTVADAPDAWAWMKENKYSGYYFDDPTNITTIKNVERWLYQRDVADGLTVKTEWVDDSAMPYRTGIVTGSEYQARRTDRASGNDYIYFDIDDRFLSGGPTDVYVKVTFLDSQPTGSWRLEYDNGSNIYTSTPDVNNTATAQWQTVTFRLPDFFADNRQNAGMDFRLYNGGTSDLTVKFVRLIKAQPAAADTISLTAQAPTTRTITQGENTSYAFTLEPVNNYVGEVFVSVTTCASNATCTLNPISCDIDYRIGGCQIQLSVTNTNTINLGSHNITVRADGQGGVSDSDSVTLIVNSAINQPPNKPTLQYQGPTP